MASADAQFTFGTNITQVSAEIQRELRRIANLSATSQGPQAGDFVRDVAGAIQKNTAAAYRELRQLKAQYDEINKSGRGLRPGEATLSQESSRVLGNLNAANLAAVRQKAAAAGPELAGLDLQALLKEIDRAIVSRARNGARAAVREAEKAGDAAGIYGTQKDIPTGVPKTNLGTVGDLQAALAAEAQAANEAAAATKARAKVEKEAADAERRRQAATDKTETDRRAGKILPPVSDLEKQLSDQVKAGIASNDPQYGFVSKTGRPSRQVFLGDDPETVRIFQQVKGQYSELARNGAEYAVAQRTVREVLDKRASDERVHAAQLAHDEDALELALQAYAKSLEIKSKLAARDPEVQYLTDRGRPTSTVAIGADPATAEFYKASKGEFVELQRSEIDFINAQRLLGDMLKDRTTAERAAAQASNRLAERLRQQAAELSAAPGGGGGIGGAFAKGLFSGGFGGGDNSNGLAGLARAAGTTVKYDLLYKTLNGLITVLQQSFSEFLNVDDSVTELNIAMGEGVDVSTTFINRLQEVAAPGGFNVGDAMDQAAASIRAYGNEAVDAALKSEGLSNTLANQQQVMEDQGTAFAKAAAQIAVLAQTTLPDAAQNTRATAIGFGLDANTAGQRVADAIAGAYRVGGGLPKDISQGGANVAEIAGRAGFGLEETLGLISKISAATDESGTLAATRISRVIGTLQGSSGKNFLTQLNQGLAPDKKIDINASPRDQIIQIAQAYNSLNEAQKQQLATAIGGQAQQKEFTVLLQSFPDIAQRSAKGFAGLASKDYEDRLKNVRGQLQQIIGDLRAIITNVGQSGLLEPLIVGLGVVKPILSLIKDITAAFNLIPAPLREIGGLLLTIFATIKAIGAVRSAGGFKGLLAGAEEVARPQAALARQQLSFGGAETKRASSLSQIAADETAGALTAGQASKARIEAERLYREEIRTSAADYRRAVRSSTGAVEEGGKSFRDSFTRLRGDQLGRNLNDLGGVIGTGSRKIASITADGATSLGSGFRTAGKAVADSARIIGNLGLGGGSRTILAAARGTDVSFGAVGRGVGAGIKGLGSLVASEIGPIGIGLIAADVALQVKAGFDHVNDAVRAGQATAGATLKQGATALHDAALNNQEAAKNLREASSGFFGSIGNYLSGNAGGIQANINERLGFQEDSLSTGLKVQQTAASQNRVTSGGLAAQIDTSSADRVTESIKNLTDAGHPAVDVMHALIIAMHGLQFVGSDKVSDLNALQQTELGGRLGIETSQFVDTIIAGLRKQATETQTTPGVRAGGVPTVAAVQARAALGQLDGGQQLAGDVVSHSFNQFIREHQGAKTTDPQVQAQFRDYLRQRLHDITNWPNDIIDKIASQAATNLPTEAANFKAALASPEVLQSTVASGLQVAATVGQDTAAQSQLASLRSGTPDRSGTAGLKAQLGQLQGLKAEVEGQIKTLEDAGLADDANFGLLELGIVNKEIDDTVIKQLQQARQDAGDVLAESTRRRQVLQAAARTAADAASIGDSFFKTDIKTALDAADPELIRQVLTNASKAEIRAYRKQLAANLAADEAALEAERRREIALGILTHDEGEKDTDPKLKAAQGKVTADQDKLKLFDTQLPQVTPNGTYSSASDAPGGTPAEKAAAQAAATAEKARDSLAGDQAAIDAAKAALAKTTEGTREYWAAQQQVYAAQNKLADDQRAAAVAGAEAALFPGDKVGQAKAAVDAAQANVNVYAKGTKEYGDAQKALNQAQYAYTLALQEAYFVNLKANSDLSDTLQQASLALRQAKAKLAKDKAAGADKQTLDQDQIDINQKANDQEAATFSRTVQHAQDLEAAGRITHAQYLQILQSEQARILERLRLMKKGQNGYVQLQNELLEIQKDVKAANAQLSGQFNLGDVKVPTVYEVRRAIAAQQSAVSAIANSTVNNNTTITINGVDTDKIMTEISKRLGGLKQGVHTTKPRKA